MPHRALTCGCPRTGGTHVGWTPAELGHPQTQVRSSRSDQVSFPLLLHPLPSGPHFALPDLTRWGFCPPKTPKEKFEGAKEEGAKGILYQSAVSPTLATF